MAKQPNLEADIKNPNKGTKGQNQSHAHNQGNRGKQLDPTPNNANQKPGNRKKIKGIDEERKGGNRSFKIEKIYAVILTNI